MLTIVNIPCFLKNRHDNLAYGTLGVLIPQNHDGIYNLYTFLYKKMAIFHEKNFL